MKYIYTILMILGSVYGWAQTTKASSGFEGVKNELTDWDPVRGPWLASSMEAMATRQVVPARNFPERYTPHQLMKLVPSDVRARALNHARANKARNESSYWSRIERYLSSTNCSYISGRSYGDPHIVSYDGARYSFQTVGEFVLTKDATNNMEVQVRQQPQGDEFSLNTAVAMNVAGDRVCIYARDYPDANYSTPVRVDGRPLQMNGSTYMLAHGGTIRKSGNTYTVDYPTGETVVAQIRDSRSNSFMQIKVLVPNCNPGNYTGILGDANGNERDDFSSPGVSPPISSRQGDYWHRERQAFIARQFAEMHRITQATSLFDYMGGRTTETYTDRGFPRVFPRYDDFNRRRFERSRRYCQEQGINPRDINGCAYDNMNLGLSAAQDPIVDDPTVGTVLRPVSREERNLNVVQPVGATGNPSDRVKPIAKPTRPSTETKPVRTDIDRDKPTTSRPDKPVRETPNRTESKPDRPRTISTPRPIRTNPPKVSTPKPRPSTPRPSTPKVTTPKPKPAPRPSTPVRRTSGSVRPGGR